jgi:hypothetical protein
MNGINAETARQGQDSNPAGRVDKYDLRGTALTVFYPSTNASVNSPLVSSSNDDDEQREEVVVGGSGGEEVTVKGNEGDVRRPRRT